MDNITSVVKHNFNWNASDPWVFINPRMSLEFAWPDFFRLIKEKNLDSHFFFATSGSTAISSVDTKWVALSKFAIFQSANAVNGHLNCCQSDIFINVLPHFHVGGFGLLARAHLLQAELVDLVQKDDFKWDPLFFVAQITRSCATISSLVPTHVYDLVKAGCKAPRSLRAIVVGGASLDKTLFEKAKSLGWPLLPSYGMSECSSQVATASFDFQWDEEKPLLSVLPHVSVSIDANQHICLSGSSLLTGYIRQSHQGCFFIDPKKEGVLITSDLGCYKNGHLILLGRNNDVVKINAENVSLERLDAFLLNLKLKNTCIQDAALLVTPSVRHGNQIGIAFLKCDQNKKFEIDAFVLQFNQQVLPFERIQKIFFVDAIPKTALGKLNRILLGKLCVSSDE